MIRLSLSLCLVFLLGNIHAQNVTGLTDKEANDACSEPDVSTTSFTMQHTSFRVKDIRRSLDFYTRILGMRLLKKIDINAMKVSLYILGYQNAGDIPNNEIERTKWALSRAATVELGHTWGSENDPNVKYYNGNDAPAQGYGHIGLNVPDVFAACKRFEELGVKFVLKPDQDGPLNGIGFIQDPDGYWIEILNADTLSTKKF